MLLLTDCEVHTARYLDHSFEVGNIWNEVHTKHLGSDIFGVETTTAK